ncbi:MAG: N-6 DNA methylase [Pseudomonadota bacterium]|nr:N-6 DNA methylase [Pseudomonadota bacterium]
MKRMNRVLPKEYLQSQTSAARATKASVITDSITTKPKNTPEQQNEGGPLVAHLVSIGWNLNQIVFGKQEWRVPRSPSEATKREKNQSFNSFFVDIAVFDRVANIGDPRHLLFMIECKQPTEQAGVSQLESYFVGEPHAQLAVWANSHEPSAPGAFLYRKADGRILLKRQKLAELPRPGEAIKPETQRLSFNDLIAPSEMILRKTMEDLLDKIVIGDSNVTRREDQLDQLCNLLLLKLESDKQGKAQPSGPVFFRPMESTTRTAAAIRERFESFVDVYPEVFVSYQDKQLRLSNETVARCVEELAGLKLIDLGLAMISLAFQVLRSEALKQGEGQYFTPQAVITAGVRLMEIKLSDIVLDPACGTGGFLVEAMLDLQRTHPSMPTSELSRWTQTHVFGIDKDAIGVKLTKAIMQIAGDGSAHAVRGDSIRTHNWSRDFAHLKHPDWKDGRFTVIVTNPPFGQNLKVTAADSRLAGLEIAKKGGDTYTDLEIGLLFFERAYSWLRKDGRLGIVLPETYFFSTNYLFLFEWMKPRFRPIVVANIPMEAFQGFCRAKTNFYVFQKIG